MSKPIYVMTLFKSKQGKVEAIKKMLDGFMAETLRKEEGCISYNYLQSVEDETQFTSLEIWQDSHAEAAHWEEQHLKNLLTQLPEVMEGEATVMKFHRI